MPITLAEHWLIRFLVVRDFTLPAHVLTNVSRTDSFLAPAGGLSIACRGSSPSSGVSASSAERVGYRKVFGTNRSVGGAQFPRKVFGAIRLCLSRTNSP
jgi:hypothetical protein